ncbi:TlpA family protein disulfide reductase [Paenibacillus oenotherae]|uniref:TlpA family protein disulfide reductase n=1 Tax=Paenibacillus oenotherae TaxID=1435645 RepID=A0ABS7DD07_9BACL|nr:TlpA disulfide reductase family protein [Paenibacillus oenotherae]MBW7477720.1 TlpA family protein disulfide reductase [Paenibacillus oenotherae]
MKRTIVLLFIVVVLTGAAIYQNNDKKEAAMAASSEMKPKPGFTAPALELPDLDDKPLAVGGKKDKLLLLNFWASWCGPCELEAPDLQALFKKYGDKVELYGVNGTTYDKERQAREFVKEFKLTFPILMDREGEATDLYKVTTFPTSFIIDSNGIVRERIPGVISMNEWEDLLEKWIKVEEEKKEKAAG